MADDRREEVANPGHAFKCRRCRTQHTTASNADTLSFDAAAVNESLKLGGALLRLKGVEEMNDVCAVSGFTPQKGLKLLCADFCK
jgi:hypothetical protein